MRRQHRQHRQQYTHATQTQDTLYAHRSFDREPVPPSQSIPFSLEDKTNVPTFDGVDAFGAIGFVTPAGAALALPATIRGPWGLWIEIGHREHGVRVRISGMRPDSDSGVLILAPFGLGFGILVVLRSVP
jgi:hypothetical protein